MKELKYFKIEPIKAKVDETITFLEQALYLTLLFSTKKP
jgi:hypothetical protein